MSCGSLLSWSADLCPGTELSGWAPSMTGWIFLQRHKLSEAFWANTTILHTVSTHIITYLQHIRFTAGKEAVQTLEAISNPYACFVDKPERHQTKRINLIIIYIFLICHNYNEKTQTIIILHPNVFSKVILKKWNINRTFCVPFHCNEQSTQYHKNAPKWIH